MGTIEQPGLVDRVRAVDVAEYILQQQGGMSAFKLQKLVYYCDAWHMVHVGRPLVREDFEAWVNGPVVRELFESHRRRYEVSTVGGNAMLVGGISREVVDEVLRAYGGMLPHQLIDLTHSEDPWLEARRGLGPMQPSSARISRETMRGYYEGLLYDDDAVDLPLGDAAPF